MNLKIQIHLLIFIHPRFYSKLKECDIGHNLTFPLKLNY